MGPTGPAGLCAPPGLAMTSSPAWAAPAPASTPRSPRRPDHRSGRTPDATSSADISRKVPAVMRTITGFPPRALALAAVLAAAAAGLTAPDAPAAAASAPAAAARPAIPHAAGHAAARLPVAFQRHDGQAGPP